MGRWNRMASVAQCGLRTKKNWTKTAYCTHAYTSAMCGHTDTMVCGHWLSIGPTEGLRLWCRSSWPSPLANNASMVRMTTVKVRHTWTRQDAWSSRHSTHSPPTPNSEELPGSCAPSANCNKSTRHVSITTHGWSLIAEADRLTTIPKYSLCMDLSICRVAQWLGRRF